MKRSVSWVGTQVFTKFPIDVSRRFRDTSKRRDELLIPRRNLRRKIRKSIFERGQWVRNRGRVPDCLEVRDRIADDSIARDLLACDQMVGPVMVQSPRTKEIIDSIARFMADGTDVVGRATVPLFAFPFFRKRAEQLFRLKVDLLRVCRSLVDGREQNTARLARTSRLSKSRVRYLTKLIEQEGRDLLIELNRQLHELRVKDHLIAAFLRRFARDDRNLDLTLEQMFSILRADVGNIANVSFWEFYRALSCEGWRHRVLRYRQIAKYAVGADSLRSFCELYLHLMVNEDDYELIFIDESAICPSNFKRRAWFPRRAPAVVHSKVRYERISVVSAITRQELVAVQFVHAGHGSAQFCYFVSAVFEKVVRRRDDERTVVLFLDNATIHHSRDLRELCARFGVAAFFNLPHTPENNPVELLWEFLKRPLRARTRYDRFPQKEKFSAAHFG